MTKSANDVVSGHAAAWEADAIEKCRNDPRIAGLGLCYVCMCSHPCICDENRTVAKMHGYFMKHREGDKERARERSWGQGDPITEMIRHLYRMATKDFKNDQR